MGDPEEGEDEAEESEEGEDVDYAVVSESGMLKPEIKPAQAEAGSEHSRRPVRIADKGIRLQTSRLSYLYTYGLAALVLVFFFLASSRFGIAFTFAPQTTLQILNDIVFIVFVAAFVCFAGEADFERMTRQYVITNTEVVKVEGILRKRRVIIPYQSVSNVEVYRSVLGRLAGFGDVNVIGFDAEINMKGMREPDTFYRIINNKIARMRGFRPTAATQPSAADEEQPRMDWRREQQSLGGKVKPPAVPEEKGDSIFGFLKKRVQSKPIEFEKRPKPRRKAARRRRK
jgi:membrane protein YdbS with pleckstrin-like domain